MTAKELAALLRYIDSAIEDAKHASAQSSFDKSKARETLLKLIQQKEKS